MIPAGSIAGSLITLNGPQQVGDDLCAGPVVHQLVKDAWVEQGARPRARWMACDRTAVPSLQSPPATCSC